MLLCVLVVLVEELVGGFVFFFFEVFCFVWVAGEGRFGACSKEQPYNSKTKQNRTM